MCDSSAAQQQVTERRKSRFELIFVEEVNMIVQSTLFRHSGSCGGAGQVTGGLCVTGPSHQGPEKREYPDAPDYEGAALQSCPNLRLKQQKYDEQEAPLGSVAGTRRQRGGCGPAWM